MSAPTKPGSQSLATTPRPQQQPYPGYPGQTSYAAHPGSPVQPPHATAPTGYVLAPAAPGTNGLAIAAFVLGLLGFAVLPVIFGHIALRQIRSRGQGGTAFAIVGLVLGYLAVAAWVVVLGIGLATLIFSGVLQAS